MALDFENSGDYVASRGGYYDGNNQWMWALLIFVIFALIMLWSRKDRNECDTVLPLLAASGGLGTGKRGECDHIWDVERDMMNQFCQTRMEAQENKYDMTRDSDKYFYEQQKTSLVGFKDVEIQGLHNTQKIESRIDRMEQNWREAEDRKKESRINYLETLVGIRGLGLVPSNPYAQVPYPYQNCNPCPQYA